MAYSKINWENEPSILTPINEANLNHMDAGIYNLDQNKLDKANPRATGSLAVSGYSLLAEPGLGSAQFGYDSIATGYNSLAAGFMTRATGSESFTVGSHTQAASENQTAIGKYNIKDNDEKYPFIIGNGTGTDEDTSNAFTVDWDGNVEAAGEITDGNGITLSELLPTDTESGNPCVITDAFGGKAKSLSLDIEPIQEGSGTPSPDNVRPISGISSATITRTGKNISPLPTKQGYWAIADGTFVSANGWVATEKIEVVPNTKYHISSSYKTTWLAIDAYDRSGTYMSNIAEQGDTAAHTVNYTITTPSDCTTIGISIRAQVSTLIPADVTDLQMEVGETATAYEPYNGQTITRTYGQTVYGGSDDVTGSGATSEWVMKTLTVNTVGTSGAGVKYADCLQTLITDNETLSNMYEQIPYSATGADGKFKVYPTAFTIYDNRFTDVATAQSILDNCQMLYKLPTPTTISLASQNIDLLHGDNVLTSNAKTVNVSYKADIQAYIEKKIAEGSGNRSLAKSEPTEVIKEPVNVIDEEPVEQNER